MRIQISLSEDSIQAAIEKLEAYKKKMDARMAKLNERLAGIGVDVMRSTYANAQYAGGNDIEVSMEFNGNKATIRADGAAVAFIEFGTGINYPMGEYAEKFGAPPHGSYGKHKGATGKSWAYAGEQGTSGRPIPGRPGIYRTDGNGPANAIPAAVKAMQDEIRKIAREVFSE